jgi:phage baseplate assembly protein W
LTVNIDTPFHIDARGRTATTPDDRHVRNMLELLLFTSPGERVNRPEFGGGVRALVFAGNGPELAAALQFNLRANLQRWLGDAIELRDLTVTPDDATLYVEITYRLRQTDQDRTVRFQRQV